MSDVKESVKRGLKRELMLVSAIILAAMALAAYDMYIAPKPQPHSQKSK